MKTNKYIFFVGEDRVPSSIPVFGTVPLSCASSFVLFHLHPAIVPAFALMQLLFIINSESDISLWMVQSRNIPFPTDSPLCQCYLSKPVSPKRINKSINRYQRFAESLFSFLCDICEVSYIMLIDIGETCTAENMQIFLGCVVKS